MSKLPRPSGEREDVKRFGLPNELHSVGDAAFRVPYRISSHLQTEGRASKPIGTLFHTLDQYSLTLTTFPLRKVTKVTF